MFSRLVIPLDLKSDDNDIRFDLAPIKEEFRGASNQAAECQPHITACTQASAFFANRTGFYTPTDCDHVFTHSLAPSCRTTGLQAFHARSVKTVRSRCEQPCFSTSKAVLMTCSATEHYRNVSDARQYSKSALVFQPRSTHISGTAIKRPGRRKDQK